MQKMFYSMSWDALVAYDLIEDPTLDVQMRLHPNGQLIVRGQFIEETRSYVIAGIEGEIPFDYAVYVPTVDKIFATAGPYVYKCNANTGTPEDYVKVGLNAQGPCCITYNEVVDKLYVGVWNAPCVQYYGNANSDWSDKDIYPVNPNTMTVEPRLGIRNYTGIFNITPAGNQGPHFIKAYGDYIYWIHVKENFGAMYIVRKNVANISESFTSWNGNFDYYDPDMYVENFDFGYISGTLWTMFVAPAYQNAERFSLSGSSYQVNENDWSKFWPTLSLAPSAVAFCHENSKLYAVGGHKWLTRINEWNNNSLSIPTAYDLDTWASGSKPSRITYNSSSGLFYIPSMNNNTIIIFDPINETAVTRSGFDAPHDMVFTPTKVFAVQQAVQGLKEVV